MTQPIWQRVLRLVRKMVIAYFSEVRSFILVTALNPIAE